MGGAVIDLAHGQPEVTGAIWLDASENWDTARNNGNPAGTIDCFTVMAHETGHVLGYGETINTDPNSPTGTVSPITSRTVRFISQSTITQREVESNPNVMDPNSTVRGPGLVAPIGLRGHFPPEIANTPPVETLPGGIPLFRDTNGDGVGDMLVGGIGVFFPGKDGYATHEQGFVPGSGQTEAARTNAPLELEAEYMALVAAGGSSLAAADGAPGAKPGVVAGIAPVAGLDVPFGRLDLVGVQLQVIGPTAGIAGVQQLLDFAQSIPQGNPKSGVDEPLQGGLAY